VSTVGGANRLLFSACSSTTGTSGGSMMAVRGETWSTVALGGLEWPAWKLGRLDECRWPLAVFLGPAVVADAWRAVDESALISETLISQARGQGPGSLQ
jgi:hypothetical protein